MISFISRVQATGAWILKMDEFHVFLAKYLGSMVLWTNDFWVVEICVFPTMNNHSLT